MISQKIRNNASISYFFLGWLFLLAKNNPNYSDSFIKQHAKIATKGHILFFIAYFFYSYLLSEFFSYSIPVIQITIDHGIRIVFFALLTLFIIRGVYSGQKDESIENISKNASMFLGEGKTFQFSGTSEAQKIVLLLSHIPFIGMIVAKRYPNVVTTTGVRLSSIFGCIYIIIFTNGGFNSLSMILLFMGIFLFLLIAARLFIYGSYTLPIYVERVPGTESIYRIIRSIPPYLHDMGEMIFGKKDSLSFLNHIKNTEEKDERIRASLQTYFIDESLMVRPFWIFIPFANIIFLPKLFTNRSTRYVLAIGQGLIITTLAILIGIFFTFTSSLELFLLFPIFYGIASLESDVFIRIPVIYEIYTILNTITFGLLSNTKKIRTVQKQDTTVSYNLQ